MQDLRWSLDKANAWYQKQPWLVGCNFIPSSAINQLEMWQADTFDLPTIDRELDWASDLGLSSMRVYLHDLLWWQDAKGLKERIHRYLDVSARKGIGTVFVRFDDCWHDDPKLGTQPEPRPGVHNPGWVKSPGTKMVKDRSQWGRLQDYVCDIVGAFGADERVVVWDLYNEPGNNFLVSLSQPPLLRYAKIISQLVGHLALPNPTAPLLRAAFSWARSARPAQPLTTGLWYMRENLSNRLNPVAVELSGVPGSLCAVDGCICRAIGLKWAGSRARRFAVGLDRGRARGSDRAQPHCAQRGAAPQCGRGIGDADSSCLQMTIG